MVEKRRLIVLLDRATDAIAEHRWQKWAGWIAFILENLQDKTNDERYIEFLRSLRGTIDARLENGRW